VSFVVFWLVRRYEITAYLASLYSITSAVIFNRSVSFELDDLDKIAMIPGLWIITHVN
jgi:hypothetical protein